MKQLWKEKANKVLSRAGEKIPVSKTCSGWWGEVELPDCLRAELEDAERVEEEK